MGGGARPRGTRTRMPGTAGLESGTTLAAPSLYYSLKSGERVKCALVFFHTGDHQLRSDGRGALHRVIQDIRRFAVNGCTVEVECEGYADVRGKVGLNEDLSRKRLAEVERILKLRLGHLTECTVHPGIPYGERQSHDSPLVWACERRVDVWARVIENPWIKTRAEIFRRYSPLYHHWPKAGLDYLIEMYEKHDQHSYPVTIKSQDLEKAYELTMIIMAESERGYLAQWAKSGDRAEVIADFYCIGYRRAYHDAFNIYLRKPEYGSLSPKE